MTLEIFNTLWIFLCTKLCLLGFRFDTSKLPFSVLAMFIIFYDVDFYIGTHCEVDDVTGRFNKYYELMIPCVCDIMIVREIKELV